MTNSGSLRNRSIRAVGWSAVHGWGSQLIGLVVFAVLAKLLQPADFGLIAMAAVFISIAGVFMDQGLAQALVQRKEIEPEHIDTAFWLNFVSGLILAAIGYAIAPSVANLYSAPELTPILRSLCLVVLLRSGSAVQIALLQRELDYRTLAFRNFLGLVVGGIVGVTMAILGYGVWSLVWQQVSNALILTITLWWFCPWKPAWRFSNKHFRDLHLFGLNIVGINIASFLSSNADKAIIGIYLGPVALGYYSLAHRLLQIMVALLAGVTASVALPVFSSLQNDIPRLREAFMTAVRLSALIAFPAFLGLAALSPILLPTLFDPKWEESIIITQILALSGTISSILFFHGNLLVSLGKPHWRLAMNTGIALFKVALFLLVVQQGIKAISIANVFCIFLAIPVSIYLVNKLISLNMNKYWRVIMEPFVSSAIMVIPVVIAARLLDSHLSSALVLIICISLGAITYIATAWVVAPSTSRELYNVVRRVILKRTNK